MVGEKGWPVRLVPHPRSRRYRLVFDPIVGELRLTMPQRGSAAKALKWAAEQQQWIAEQTAKSIRPHFVGAGTMLPYDDQMLQVQWQADWPRAPQRRGDELHVGGPEESLSRRIETWLKSRALTLMEQESRILAAQAGLSVGRVSIGDPRSRWGSCTAQGDLRYSWRLIMAPAHVRRATVAHEVAHLKHMDHSPAFHRFVAQLYDGDVDTARQWLRAHGRELHQYRFSR